MAEAAPIARITEHLRDAYGFTMKSVVNGGDFRVLPLRDPGQPRFWCIVVVRNLAAGGFDRTHPAWIGRRGLRREDLAAIMAAIRDDLEAWLADPAQETLLSWVQTPNPEGVPPDAGSASTHERSGSSEGVPPLIVPTDHRVAGGVARVVA